MAWSKLPTELHINIIQYLDCASLKALRIADKQYGLPVATSFLFRTIYIMPDATSVANARTIAETSGLNDHVTEIVLNIDPLPERFVADSEDFKNVTESWAALPPIPGSNSIQTRPSTKSWLAMYERYLTRIKAQRDFSRIDRVFDLKLLFTQLRKSSRVSIKLVDAHLPGMIDECSMTVWRSMLMRSANDVEGSKCSLGDIMHLPVNNVVLNATDFNGFGKIDAQPQDLSSSCLFEHLERLHLHFYDAEYSRPGHRERALTMFDAFLASTESRLVHLSLDFDSHMRNRPPHSGVKPISPIILCRNWTKLRTFRFKGMIVHEDTFVEFLSRHKETLRELYLTNIEFTKTETATPTTDSMDLASVYTFLWRSSRCCDLENVSLDGFFTNGVNEAWRAKKDIEGKDNLRSRFEQFMCHRAPWPFLPIDKWKEWLCQRRAPTFPMLNYDKATRSLIDESWCGDVYQNDFGI